VKIKLLRPRGLHIFRTRRILFYFQLCYMMEREGDIRERKKRGLKVYIPQILDSTVLIHKNT